MATVRKRASNDPAISSTVEMLQEVLERVANTVVLLEGGVVGRCVVVMSGRVVLFGTGAMADQTRSEEKSITTVRILVEGYVSARTATGTAWRPSVWERKSVLSGVCCVHFV
jgi:hypothetical protein